MKFDFTQDDVKNLKALILAAPIKGIDAAVVVGLISKLNSPIIEVKDEGKTK